jgi:hypothetical protein
MKREWLSLSLALTLASACGGGKSTPKSPDEVASAAKDGGTSADGGADAAAPVSAACTGPNLDLANVLIQSACEVPTPPGDTKPLDVSKSLEVKVVPIPAEVPPGGHSDLLITYTNKSAAPLTLSFLLDPTPRFTLEVYNSKNARAEMPRSSAPNRPGVPAGETSSGIAQVTIPAGSKAAAKVDFNAVRLRWAPELVKGTPPELGYPTAPAGPLPKGVYTLKVITPLTGVFEGMDKEVSTVRTTVTVK